MARISKDILDNIKSSSYYPDNQNFYGHDEENGAKEIDHFIDAKRIERTLEINKKVIEIADYIIEHNCGQVEVMDAFNISRSSVHSYINKKLPIIDKRRYLLCKNIFGSKIGRRKITERDLENYNKTKEKSL